MSVNSTRTSYVLTMGTILHNIDYAERYFWHTVPAWQRRIAEHVTKITLNFELCLKLVERIKQYIIIATCTSFPIAQFRAYVSFPFFRILCVPYLCFIYLFIFWWCSFCSLPSIRYTFSDFNVKLNLEMMLTVLTGIPFVPSNKVIMHFRHIYSEERSCLFMDHFILQSQGRNSELQIRVSPTWSPGNFISLLTQGEF